MNHPIAYVTCDFDDIELIEGDALYEVADPEVAKMVRGSHVYSRSPDGVGALVFLRPNHVRRADEPVAKQNQEAARSVKNLPSLGGLGLA